jgi:hypothetical protein
MYPEKSDIDAISNCYLGIICTYLFHRILLMDTLDI